MVNTKLILICYYVLAFTVSLGYIISFSPFPGIRLYFFDFPTILISFFSVPLAWKLRNAIFAQTKFFVLFVLISLVGLLLSAYSVEELLVSIAYLMRILLYLSITIPFAYLNRKQIYKVLTAFFVSGIFFVTIGYIQYVFYSDLANLYYLGWDRHLFRFFSTFLDPNFTGVYVVILLLFSTGFLSVKFKKSIWRQLVVGLIFFPALFLTYSRTAYISAVISIGSFLLFFSKKYLLLFVCVFVLGLFVVPKDLGGEGVKLLRSTSIYQRVKTFEGATVIFLKNPFVGVGFNNYKYAQMREGILLSKDTSSHAASGVSNSYLLILATSGIFGFVSLMLFVFTIIKKLYTGKDVFSKTVFCACLSVLTASFFENALFYAPIILILAVLIPSAIKLQKVT